MNLTDNSFRQSSIQDRDLAFRYGIHFQAKLIGTMVIEQPRNQLDVLSITRQTRQQFQSRRIPKVKVEVIVAIHGVKVVKSRPKTRIFWKAKEWDDVTRLVTSHPLYRIYYVCNDPQELVVFSYITKDIDDVFKCHLFKAFSKEEAAQLVQIMCEAFEIAPRFNHIMYPGSCEPTRKFSEDRVLLPDAGIKSDSEAIVREWLPSTIKQLEKSRVSESVTDMGHQETPQLTRKLSHTSLHSAPVTKRIRDTSKRSSVDNAAVSGRRKQKKKPKAEAEEEDHEYEDHEKRRASKSSSSALSQKAKSERSSSIFNFLPSVSRHDNTAKPQSPLATLQEDTPTQPEPSPQPPPAMHGLQDHVMPPLHVNPNLFPGPQPPPVTTVPTSLPDLLLNSYTAALTDNLTRSIIAGLPYANFPGPTYTPQYPLPFSFGYGIPQMPTFMPQPQTSPRTNEQLEREVEQLKKNEDDLRREVNHATEASEKISVQVQAVFDKLRDIEQRMFQKPPNLPDSRFSSFSSPPPVVEPRRRSTILPQVKADLERLNHLYEQTIAAGRAVDETLPSTSHAPSPPKEMSPSQSPPSKPGRAAVARSRSLDSKLYRPRLPSFVSEGSQASSAVAESDDESKYQSDTPSTSKCDSLSEAKPSSSEDHDTTLTNTVTTVTFTVPQFSASAASNIVDTTTSYTQQNKRRGPELWALLRKHMLADTVSSNSYAMQQDEKFRRATEMLSQQSRLPTAFDLGDRQSSTDSERKRKRSNAMNLWHYVLDNMEILKQARKESKDMERKDSNEYGLPSDTKSISQGGVRRFHSGLRINTVSEESKVESLKSSPIIVESNPTDPLKSALKSRTTFNILSRPEQLSRTTDLPLKQNQAVKFLDPLQTSQDDTALAQKTKTVSFLERMSSSSSDQGSLMH